MSNLLYREYKTGCYNYNNNGTLDKYEYGNSNSAMASYYADLLPNTTYTLKKWDSSSRFRVALYTNDVKILTGSGYDYSITQWWLSDSTDTITFTTGSTDIHLVVYYTNNYEYTTRVMLNTGSVADAYEAPTKSIPEWYMDGDQPTPIAALPIVHEHFTEPYPDTLWQYEGGDTPINGLMLPILQEHFTKPYPASLWSIDESNGGLPYTELMPDILYVERKGGAFEGAENLEQVKIPPSVKEIGEKAFADTALTEVTIAEDCTYYGTSFPQDCVINIYPE